MKAISDRLYRVGSGKDVDSDCLKSVAGTYLELVDLRLRSRWGHDGSVTKT